MKKVLPWVISCTFLYSLCVANENSQSMGLGVHCCLFIFCICSSYTISCSFSRYLNVFNNKKLVITGYLLSLTTGIYLVNALQKLSDKDIHEW